MSEKHEQINQYLGVLLNGVAQLEYDRQRELSDYQRDYLANMDQRMDGGIEIGDELIAEPDAMARVKFVAGNLLHAMKSGDEALSAAFCAYMATRMPDLDQVRITEINEEVSIELVFDQPYRKQVAIPVKLNS